MESWYPTSHGPEAMTVYYPTDRQPNAAAVVMVHGGGWRGGSRSLLDPEARQAAAAGLVVFNIEYDLDSPRYPRQVQDVEAAIAHIRANSGMFGIDRDRVGGLGTSAGAQLIMQNVTTGRAPLKAVVGWSGPYDLTNHGGIKDRALAVNAATVYLDCLPLTLNCEATAKQASPLHNVTTGGPPTLLFNSTNELIAADQMTGFADRLRAAGTPVEMHLLAGPRHAIAYADDATAPTVAFLKEHLKRP
ncbi:alpha/beta hydrolase [Saccharopolyspora sp. 5N102]|uniref:alpha/beta hydrolase n=1 Tax=Saccharopolyspora sp. 5N102 TaxID=3375155 RepID=UPI0037A7DEBC